MEAGRCCSLWKLWGKKNLIPVVYHMRALQGRFLQGGTVTRKSVLVRDELASDTPQYAGLPGCCLLTAWGLSGALPSQDLGAVWERSKAGAALDALPGPRRGVVTGSELQTTFS